MNREKSREVALQIRKEDGAHWYQGAWWLAGNPGAEVETMPVSRLLERKCGTTGCVAGWTVALEHPEAYFTGVRRFGIVGKTGKTEYADIYDEAQYVLGLTMDQASWLFHGGRTMYQVLWALENDDPDWNPENYYLSRISEG